MSLRRVNVLELETDEALDEAGFRHERCSLRERLGAHAIGATLYDAPPGAPIWPYGYHHGVEEWLHVISGAPGLREPAGERALAPGDTVCFPSGERGAHGVSGPGRFLILSTGDHVEPWLSVYPDSDKISGPGGIFPRGSAVGYWHREGTSPPAADPAVVVREGEPGPPRPVIDIRSVGLDETPDGVRGLDLGARLGAERLGARVLELAPEQGAEAYHWEFGRETWVLVLAGTPVIRHPAGTDVLRPGDVVCLPDGPAGARRLAGAGESVARLLLVSTLGLPAGAHFPDSGEWRLRPGPGREDVWLRDPEVSGS